MNTNTKPRICEVLGGKDNPLEVGEEWRSTGKDIATYRINEDGHLEFRMPRRDGGPSGNWIISDIYHLAGLIEHPESIIRQPRFTGDEVATMRVLYACGAKYIAKDGQSKQAWWYFDEPSNRGDGYYNSLGGTIGALPPGALPALLPGQSITIADIINGR